jgi:hypothetical protein
MSAQGYTFESMQQVVPLLWIGDISAAYDSETLKQNGIHSVLSVFNGDIEVHPVRSSHNFLCAFEI